MVDAQGCGTVRTVPKVSGSGYFGELSVYSFQLSRVVEFQGQDIEILSIKDLVRSNTDDEGWTMHINGSLRYRGWVMVL